MWVLDVWTGLGVSLMVFVENYLSHCGPSIVMPSLSPVLPTVTQTHKCFFYQTRKITKRKLMLAHRFRQDRDSLFLISKPDSGPLLFSFWDSFFQWWWFIFLQSFYLETNIPDCWSWPLSVFYQNIFEGRKTRRNNCNRIRGFINIGELSSLGLKRSSFIPGLDGVISDKLLGGRQIAVEFWCQYYVNIAGYIKPYQPINNCQWWRT